MTDASVRLNPVTRDGPFTKVRHILRRPCSSVGEPAMSKLTETQRAYDALDKLIDAELLKRGSSVQNLQRYRRRPALRSHFISSAGRSLNT